jgi:hypothetical protein
MLVAAVTACTQAPMPPAEPQFHAASVEHHVDGGIARGLLAAPATIHGVPCRGWVRLNAAGGIAACELAAQTTIQGHTLPAASQVTFDEDGRLQSAILACDTVLQGRTCRGGPWRIPTSFHPNGNLRAFVPREPLLVDGALCESTTQAPVILHEDGRLARCRLAAEATIDGRTLRRGDTVELDAAGRLVLPAH